MSGAPRNTLFKFMVSFFGLWKFVHRCRYVRVELMDIVHCIWDTGYFSGSRMQPFGNQWAPPRRRNEARRRSAGPRFSADTPRIAPPPPTHPRKTSQRGPLASADTHTDCIPNNQSRMSPTYAVPARTPCINMAFGGSRSSRRALAKGAK